MKALITGANGQLGTELKKVLPNAIATDHNDLDITNAESIREFDWSKIDVIYNAAAYTNVDGAEQDPRAAWNINAHGVANLAIAAQTHDIPLVHVSTDYVFDGTASTPYPETSVMNPKSMYGRTKAGGEFAAAIAPKHYVVRTSWVYGEGSNFVRTMLKLAETRDELTVVNDQLGRPTYAKDLAQVLVSLVETTAPYGTYHASNSGKVISWADFAEAIFKTGGRSCKVTPITTAEYLQGKPAIAPRPAHSALAQGKLEAQGIHVRDWQPALEEYLQSQAAKK